MALPVVSDFLFELYSEEIPAAYHEGVIKYWQATLPKALNEALIIYSGVRIETTPRRLVVVIEGLAPYQKLIKESLKGPARSFCFKEGEPTAAIKGFAAKAGLSVEQVEFISDGKQEYAAATVELGGQKAIPLIDGLLAGMIQNTPFARRMRWGNYDFLYARPLLSYLSVYQGQAITFSSAELWQILPSASGVIPHFILSPKAIPVTTVAEYQAALQKAGVISDHAERKKNIHEQLVQAAHKLDGTAVVSDSLLNEVTWLTEKPTVVAAEFAAEFLKLPECVILSEMQDHQRYFGIRDRSGKLSNHFLIVSNAQVQDAATLVHVRTGNVRVLRARLEDGAFFYQQDVKKKLSERVDDLQQIVFHEGLGTMLDKANRLKKHVRFLYSELAVSGVELSKLERAAELCKADLTTQLVYEFDHLQGEIGSIYAQKDGEDVSVSQAIFEHYLPRNQNDDYPKSKMDSLLSLADKLDNVCAGFILGKQPTSSTDPFGLRRQIIYVLEIIIQNQFSFDFISLIKGFLSNFNKQDDALASALWEFTRARFLTLFEKEGLDKHIIRAGVFSGGQDVYNLYIRMVALKNLKAAGDAQGFTSLMQSFKRMSHILTDFTKKHSSIQLPQVPNEDLYTLNEEKQLHQLAQELQSRAVACQSEDDFTQLFLFLAGNKETVDTFFDKVMVMHDDEKIRNNRLALLRAAVNPISLLLDLSQLPS